MKTPTWLRIAAVTTAVWSQSGPAAEPADLAALTQLVEQQSRQIAELTARLQAVEAGSGQTGQPPAADINARLSKVEAQAAEAEQLRQQLQETNVALAETNSRVDNKIQLGKGIDGLKLTGDVRVRYETRDRQVDQYDLKGSTDRDRSRLRERVRVGGIWNNKEEKWEVGLGVATGNGRDKSLTTADGRSTDADWGRNGAFDHLELWLDYAYAKHRWDYDGTPLSLTLGQHKSPFVGSPLTWDPDLRPLGLSLQYGEPLGKEYSGFFASAGAYELYYLADGTVIAGGDEQDGIDDNVFWFAAQTGYKTKDWLLAAGYQRVSDAYRNVGAGYGASQVPNSPDSRYGNDSGYGYDIIDLYGEYKLKLASIEVKPYGQIAYNLSADGSKSQAPNAGATTPDSENLGWLLGLDLRYGPWSAGYAYAYVGADAVFGPLRDNTFGDTLGLTDTDLQGHILRTGYDVTKNLNVGAAYYLGQRLNGGSSKTENVADSARMLQLEATYTF